MLDKHLAHEHFIIDRHDLILYARCKHDYLSQGDPDVQNFSNRRYRLHWFPHLRRALGAGA